MHQVVTSLSFCEERKTIIEEVTFCKVSRKLAFIVNETRLLLKQPVS
jgi:hypothetical protein